MSQFLGRLVLSQLPSASWKLWELYQPLTFELGHRGSGRVIIVPKGMISDGPTIPRCLWVILPVFGRYGRAGILHDYLCARVTLGRPHPRARTRDQADAIFLQAMESLGVGGPTKWLLYAGVRIGTWVGLSSKTMEQNYHLLAEQNK